MMTIPLQAVPNQTLTVQLAGQDTQLNIYQKSATGVLGYRENPIGHLYMDVLVNNAYVISGVLCLNRSLIVRSTYLGFLGDFAWDDTQGLTDPVYTGVGARYQLNYLEPADTAAFPYGIT